MNCRLPIGELPIADWGLLIADWGLLIADWGIG